MLAVVLLLPILKTAVSDGFLVRFALADVFIFLTAAGTLVALGRGRAGAWRELRVPSQALAGLACFFPLVLLSFAAAESVERSLVEATAYAVNAALAALIVFHLRTREDLFEAFLAWERGVIVTVAVGLAGLALLFTGNFDTALTEGPKLASTFKKSGQLSAYLMPSVAILWFNFAFRSPTRRARFWRGVLFFLLFVCLVGTGSRTGLALGSGVFLLLFGGRWAMGFLDRPVLKLGLAALAFALLVPIGAWVSGYLPFSFQRAFSIVSGTGSLETLSPTRYYQYLGWEVAAAEYPLTGVGAGNFHELTTSFVPAAWKSHEIHNTYLGVWAETGMLGLAALVVLYLGVLQSAWEGMGHARDETLRALQFALLTAFLVLVIYGMSNFGLRMRHLGAVFGLTLAAWNVVRQEKAAAAAGRSSGAAA